MRPRVEKVVIFAVLVLLTGSFFAGREVPRAAAETGAESAPRFPAIYWTEGVETADRIRRAGVEPIAVPAENAAGWRGAGIKVVSVAKAELESRRKTLVPRIAGRGNVASATRRPWIDANGWMYIRRPSGRYFAELPAGRAALAAAEACVYQVDLLMKIEPGDLEAVGGVFSYFRSLPSGGALTPVADLAVIEDGSDEVGEVMNLLTRRNLLFEPLARPSAKYRINIRLGSKAYPAAEAADPSEFALKIRRQLGDEKRSLRIYGSETVFARYSAGGGVFRLQLLNYSNSQIDGLRVRLLGAGVAGARAWAHGFGEFAPETPVQADGAAEFSIPRMKMHTMIEGRLASLDRRFGHGRTLHRDR
ncbi:MAG: hypothetical protein SF339_06275 [Blastocatellia bacterium]|nr:hypothetical protein [Blastocatellia bacterium]